jgi:hypothetical protein
MPSGLTGGGASREVRLDKRPHAMKGHPLAAHALSEQKLFRDSISDIVAEKNQKNEKLLTDKTGR